MSWIEQRKQAVRDARVTDRYAELDAITQEWVEPVEEPRNDTASPAATFTLPAPQITVEAAPSPEVNVEVAAPIVQPPDIHVAAPNVEVHVPARGRTSKTVTFERDVLTGQVIAAHVVEEENHA